MAYQIPTKRITNPLIINLGISDYDSKQLKPLPGCKVDLITMNTLWTKTFGFKTIYQNKSPRYTSKDVWILLRKARRALFDDDDDDDDDVDDDVDDDDAELMD